MKSCKEILLGTLERNSCKEFLGRTVATDYYKHTFKDKSKLFLGSSGSSEFHRQITLNDETLEDLLTLQCLKNRKCKLSMKFMKSNQNQNLD